MKPTLAYRFLFVLAAALTLLPSPALPHPGGIDANGGHTNRKTGEYHFHHKGVRQAANTSDRPIFFRISESERDRAIGDYFRRANEGVGALDCDVVIHDRDVPQSVKRRVRNRDGNQCVICGSTLKLEVDHKQALMNGGDNSFANLATLCDDCHTIKTRMDNSLRRKRQRMCRGN